MQANADCPRRFHYLQVSRNILGKQKVTKPDHVSCNLLLRSLWTVMKRCWMHKPRDRFTAGQVREAMKGIRESVPPSVNQCEDNLKWPNLL